MIILKIIVCLVSLGALCLSVSSFMARKFNAATLYYPVFFVFFPLHLILDIVIGEPRYELKFPGFISPYLDMETNFYYLLFLLITIFVIVFFQLRGRVVHFSEIKFNSKVVYFFKIVLWVLILSGPCSLILSSKPSVYLSYAAIREYQGDLLYEQHGLIWFFTFISAFAVIFYRLASEKRGVFLSSFLLLFLFLDIYINSKRFVFIFLVLFFLIDYMKAKHNIVWQRLILLVSCFVFIGLYANYEKFDYEQSVDESYLNARVEWGRDDVLKFAIYERIVSDQAIVDYPGQSFVFTAFGYMPREWYLSIFSDEKPYPYAQYLTGMLLSGHQGASLYGWSMTTSFFDEMISNFGAAGFILALIMLVFFFRIADRQENIFKKVFYLLILSLLTVCHTAPFLLLIYLFFVFLFFDFIRYVRRLMAIR